MRHSIRYRTAAALLALAACSGAGDDPAGPNPNPNECRGAQDFQSCLPNWQTYAPPQPDQEPAVQGTPVTRDVVEPLERIDDAGATVSLGNVTFVCTDQTYNFVDNPERAVSFNIDETVIWPGALVQGRTHRDGGTIGSLLELPIRERAPLVVTLSFNNQDNTRTVDAPASGSVRAAVGSMIGNAEAQGLATSNNIEFFAETFSSEKQAAVAFGFSGRYLAFEAKASGSLTRTSTTNTVAAKFVQQMYIAGVTQPATPQAFFSSAFSSARYDEHESFGRIGPDNPPLYVSRIGYGRMMVFAMTAKAEGTEMKGALDAAWRGVGASAGVQLSAKETAILQQSQIRITQVGGDQTNALNAIRTGRLADYFTDRAPLTSAAPLWFELKSLTGQVAAVSEPGTYTETTCIPRLPGTFDYQNEATLAVPFTAGTQRQVVQADVNGDDRMDLVFNERRSGPSLNRVHVALGQTAGGFVVQAPATNPNAPTEGWENYQVIVADVDGDGRDDLAWNHRGQNNVVYIGMSEGSGSFAWRDRKVHTAPGWQTYTVTTGDLNGDGKTDLLWNTRTGTAITRTYFGLAQADSSFAMIANFIDQPGNYSGYAPARVGRFNGDANADVALNAIGSTFNSTYIGRFTPTSPTAGTLSWAAPHSRPSNWTGYQWLIGDVDGVNATDLIWVRSTTATAAVHRSLNTGNAAFTSPSGQTASIGAGAVGYIADFNNDGRSDLLLNRRVADSNELLVGFGSASGAFTFPAGPQKHPATPGVGWVPFDQVFVGDVNGDGKADIVWTNPSSDARVFVALSR